MAGNKINTKKLLRMSDHEITETGERGCTPQYSRVLISRYLAYIYGGFVKMSGSADTACEWTREFTENFSGSKPDPSNIEEYVHEHITDFASLKKNKRTAENRPGFSVAQREFLFRLINRDEDCLVLYENLKAKLTKPQRECIELFCLKGETFESIAERAGYLTDKVRWYIESGINAIFEDEKAIAGLTHINDRPFPQNTQQKFIQYLRGNRRGEAAYEIELQAMLHPLISDAFEGCMVVEGDHAGNIAELEAELLKKPSFFKRTHTVKWGIVLICILAIIICAVCFFRSTSKNEAVADMNVLPLTATVTDRDNSPEYADYGDSEKIIPVNERTETLPVENQPADIALPGDTAARVSLVKISETVSKEGKTHYISRPQIGIKKYNDFLRRSSQGSADNVKGEVTLVFMVNKYGRPSKIRVVEYLSQDAHREALRLLESGPEWMPADHEVTVVVRFN